MSMRNYARAIFGTSGTLSLMSEQEWRDRLRAAVEKSGRSPRSICLKAGLKAEWYSHWMANGSVPYLTKFVAFCDELGISPGEILTGIKMTKRGEEFLKLFNDLSSEQQAAIEAMVRASASKSSA